MMTEWTQWEHAPGVEQEAEWHHRATHGTSTQGACSPLVAHADSKWTTDIPTSDQQNK